ncbi:SH3 domain-containing protein [Leptospira gomenensis]|uniref:SH3 domain-containing protein n=1 Tax=Leptospira gomenensis TaxID=2484974 RepID=A0A5F1YYD2_9LEPT|nr:SH3 domain-containing protein [Leptospira gomenensis]TGK34937.1 SH3 domain-containing protein [Leptospira gomenensis]TGK36733.1 SH3 domain-containing protein [Leptospira gomenensis]TGK48862.1 SH3 domain-containing protein [Leptospira gomenensis]TGK64628.1 SH3 domain-containing protein [Leptospira gomenensis]
MQWKILSLFTVCFVFTALNAGEKKSPRYVVTIEGKLNVREKPKDGKILFQLEKGEIVSINEDAQSEEWLAITTRTGAKGYAAAEFLSKKPPADLDNAILFGSVYTSTEGSWFRSLAVRIKNEWLSANDHSAEAYYLEKLKTQNRQKATVYQSTNVVGEFDPEKKETTGCQEVRVLKGSLFAFGKINTLETSTFGIFGSKIEGKVRSERYTPSEKTAKQLDESITAVFRKKHPKQAELKFLKRGELYKILSPDKEYVFVRYAIKVEVEEKSYYAALYELNGDVLGKRIFEKFDTLIGEQTFYGGQYHFLDAFDLDENGTPILIIHHNGYDGFIDEFMRLKNGKLQSMFLTGGDAC